MELNGIGALVAGGGSGLGAATARELASRGARVSVVDLDAGRAEAVAAELGDGAIALRADVTEEAEVEAAVAATVEAFGGIRLAVSCAGIGWAERTVSKRGAAALQPFETRGAREPDRHLERAAAVLRGDGGRRARRRAASAARW